MKNRPGRVKPRFLVAALMVAAGTYLPRMSVKAETGCPDVRVIFARGSGAEKETSQDYQSFRSAIDDRLMTTGLTYDFVDLEYPAVGVGLDNLGVTLGAFFSGGEAYEFGESVNVGVKNLKKYAADTSCRDTKYVLGGYSQGAMVILKALSSFRPEQVIYVATFGDPKIYLPEGEGVIPAACRGENLSDYRMYVPDCQAYKGLLGAYIPYEPEAYEGKLGTWCNKRDIMCSSHLSVSDHVGYTSEGLYEDASWVIADKMMSTFGIERTTYSLHDTAFLIDSTGSMYGMIDQYKAEALRLAKETLDNGGRVALYDYRDLRDPYTPVKHCDFENCTLEIFEAELSKIKANGGGDRPESLLSASFQVMQEQNWKLGSTKSLVVLTDADYLSPDSDGITFDKVVQLSKKIDPVNIYVITSEYFGDFYLELTGRTDGLVVTNFDELSLLTDYIIERYDSLPRVEESDTIGEKPELQVTSATQVGANSIKVEIETTGEQTLVIINGTLIGVTNQTNFTINDFDVDNDELMLVPLADEIRGDAVVVTVLKDEGYGRAGDATIELDSTLIIVPKAPNTGRA